MPGREKTKKSAKYRNPLGEDIHSDRFASVKASKLVRSNDDDETDDLNGGGLLLPNHTTHRILRTARQQLQTEEEDPNDGEESNNSGDQDTLNKVQMENEMDVGGKEDERRFEDADEEDVVELEYDDHESVVTEVEPFNDLCHEYEMDDEEKRLLAKFQPATGQQTRNLADIIMERIKTQEASNKEAAMGGEAGGGTSDEPPVDKRVARVYIQIGQILKRYTSGKIPKAFKVLPFIQNWEELLVLTQPHNWSPHATYNATRIFAANLNEKMAQRFYVSVLFPIIHHRLLEEKKLHPALYMAVRKALFKPVAFFKGFLLPLVQDGECTLREALVVASVLQKTHLPPVPTAVALVKISQLPFSGPNCVFLRVFIDKKMSLPYQAIDALVVHFHKFVLSHSSSEPLPVLWHQTFLSFVQRYKEDLTEEQVELLKQVCSKHFHHLITPEIRREIQVAEKCAEKKRKLKNSLKN